MRATAQLITESHGSPSQWGQSRAGNKRDAFCWGAGHIDPQTTIYSRVLSAFTRDPVEKVGRRVSWGSLSCVSGSRLSWWFRWFSDENKLKESLWRQSRTYQKNLAGSLGQRRKQGLKEEKPGENICRLGCGWGVKSRHPDAAAKEAESQIISLVKAKELWGWKGRAA